MEYLLFCSMRVSFTAQCRFYRETKECLLSPSFMDQGASVLFICFYLKRNSVILHLSPFYNSRSNKMLRVFSQTISLMLLQFFSLRKSYWNLFKELLLVFKIWRMQKVSEEIQVVLDCREFWQYLSNWVNFCFFSWSNWDSQWLKLTTNWF